MSKYIRSVKVPVTHDGDSLSFTLKPLKLADLILIRGAIDRGEESMLIEYVKMLPAYVSEMTGVKDSEGKDIGVESLSDAYWLPVVAEIMAAHIQSAAPSDPMRPGAQ